MAAAAQQLCRLHSGPAALEERSQPWTTMNLRGTRQPKMGPCSFFLWRRPAAPAASSSRASSRLRSWAMVVGAAGQGNWL